MTMSRAATIMPQLPRYLRQYQTIQTVAMLNSTVGMRAVKSDTPNRKYDKAIM